MNSEGSELDTDFLSRTEGLQGVYPDWRGSNMTQVERHTNCPLAAVDRRLEDAHQQWHQAEATYFDPDAFRRNIQTAIQTLRSVTFVLQNNKRIIPDFDAWYEPWRERLKADGLMSWMVEARNRIEKQGDLEAHSFVRAAIVASYLEEGPEIQVPADLFSAPWTLVKNIPDNLLGEHLRQNGVLEVERKWIENSLPEYELLDAVAIAYGRISQVVDDAHRQMGLEPPATTNMLTGEAFTDGWRNGRLPCMISHRETRTARFRLSDGTPAELERKAVKFDAAEAERVSARYDIDPKNAFGSENNNRAVLQSLFETAKKMFLADRYHDSIVFLLRNGAPIHIMSLRPEDQSQKYLMMRGVADDVVRSGADAVIFISEVWISQADPNKRYLRAALAPDRREALTATLVAKDDGPVQMVAEILRDGNDVALEQTSIVTGHAAFAFAPIYKAWGKEIPQEWLGMFDESSD
ncbi:hypothetical protein [Microvirga sp. M2]|uniref:hypothetical protein n=1 Tax=Microvirga sp. M2 TaxID=3073270 RepID=UPI0039C36A08